jgi:hypothetical protein
MRFTVVAITEKTKKVGIGTDLPSALKNVKWLKSDKVAITLYECEPSKIQVREDMQMSIPFGTKSFNLTSGFEKL